MERLWPKLRGVSLLAAGSMLVHELRYVAGYGSNAGKALAEQGHSYMPWIEALTSVLVLATLVRFALSIVSASRGGVSEVRPPRFHRLWLGSSVALTAVYTLQEGFEGTFAPGHPAGVVGVFGHGGWTALLFSMLVGALVAAVTKLAYHAVRLVARRAARYEPSASTPPSWPLTRPVGGRRLDVLAWNLAGRAPPKRDLLELRGSVPRAAI
jgi:hypothetical protein